MEKQKDSSTESSRSLPKLRFPEFQGDWKCITLIELTENGFSNGAFNDPRKVGRGYRIINVKDMYAVGTINVDNLTRVEIDEKEFSKNRVEFGDIFFTRSSLVKEGIAYSNVNLSNAKDITFDGHLIRIRPKKEKYSPVFLYYNFATSNARIQFIQRGKTTTMTTIGQEDIATVEIILPTLPEQTKIATFLTAVDEKLQALKKKKSLLEDYKKGVMQKLFSQELRFKDEDGKDFPEWEEKKLGEVTTYVDYRGRAPIKTEEGYFLVTAKNIKKGFIDYECSKEYVAEYDYLNVMSKGLPEVGDVLFTTEAPMGNVAQVDKRNIALAQRVIKFRSKEMLSNLYLLHYMLSDMFQKLISEKAIGTTVQGISGKELHQIKLSLPVLPEQTKIANFLSAIDEKIQAMQVQIEKTEGWKKGLLQKMFC